MLVVVVTVVATFTVYRQHRLGRGNPRLLRCRNRHVGPSARNNRETLPSNIHQHSGQRASGHAARVADAIESYSCTRTRSKRGMIRLVAAS